MVELIGIEPTTSSLRTMASSTQPHKVPALRAARTSGRSCDSRLCRDPGNGFRSCARRFGVWGGAALPGTKRADCPQGLEHGTKTEQNGISGITQSHGAKEVLDFAARWKMFENHNDEARFTEILSVLSYRHNEPPCGAQQSTT